MTAPRSDRLALPKLLVDEAVRAALDEDLGLAGDITTDPIIPADAEGAASIVAREPGVIAGLLFLVGQRSRRDRKSSWLGGGTYR